MPRATPAPTCEVHGLPLQPGHATIFYGLPERRWFAAWIEAERTRFPHARTRQAGGCIVSPNNPPCDEVLYCPACREALARWDAQWERDRDLRGDGVGDDDASPPAVGGARDGET